MVFGYDDGYVSCYNSAATKLWTFGFASDMGINPATQYVGMTEPLLVDLNKDGVAEVIFATYGYPDVTIKNQWLYILSSAGVKLFKIDLNDATTNPGAAANGNGGGVSGAPTVADIDGNGTLEIIVHTYDARMLIFTVPGSATNCMLWPTGRGGYLRKGQSDAGVY